jgi:hypothetical protein
LESENGFQAELNSIKFHALSNFTRGAPMVQVQSSGPENIFTEIGGGGDGRGRFRNANIVEEVG